ncbi:MAG: Crp/Fnr family transcriptional regulator [Spirochaetales bacterium]
MKPEEALRKVSLFEGLSNHHLKILSRSCTEREFEAGDYVVRQGNPGIGLFIISEGTVRVEKTSENGTVIHLATHGPGEVVGEMSVIDGATRSASVIAEEPTTCLVLPSWAFNSFLEEHPTVAVHILPVVVRRFRETNEALIGLKYGS